MASTSSSFTTIHEEPALRFRRTPPTLSHLIEMNSPLLSKYSNQDFQVNQHFVLAPNKAELNALHLLLSPDPRGLPVEGVLELMNEFQNWSDSGLRLLAALVNSRHGCLPSLSAVLLRGLNLCLSRSSIFTLNLYNHGLGDSTIATIACSLQTNTSLTTLHLHGNAIGEKGTLAIANALKFNTALTTLNISGNRIGDSGSAALAGALRVNCTLTTLNLCDNEIGNPGCVALASALEVNCTLSTLQLCCNHIGDEGCTGLASSLRVNSVLAYLYLQRNLIEDRGCIEVAEALKANTTLTTLHLSGNLIGESVKPSLRSTSPRMKRVGFDL